MKTLFSVFIACALFSIAFAQLPLPKYGCKDICKANTDVKPENSVGIWYLTHAVPFSYSVDARCSYLNITNGKDKTKIIENHEILKDGQKRITEGQMIFAGPKVTADYSDLNLPFESQVFFITTDVVLLLFCQECGFYTKKGAGVYAYLYSKSLYTSCDAIDATFDLVKSCGISLNSLKPVQHSNCTASC